ncbi:hypothetical protein MHO82_11525 [Vibrio sp. Of7-15]|uniref:hypothetical protein n=1 Tax=Vibrio sp. Of7-15 TaxID=2724879 RepID=UPI001EF24CF6|nr:hypothetical protein [Vibrio sp. Of7-15]MCG7497495.1 hypothetical protein [Vibrio sp. Of7-15]
MKTMITHTHGEINFKVEVEEIDSFTTLNELADFYVNISYQINKNMTEYSVNNEYGSLTYGVDVVTPEGLVEEEVIFTKFANDPMLSSKAVNFIFNVINWCKTNSSHLWQDDENPLAECAAYALCMHDEKYIPLYIELLLQNDMDHEVYQNEHIGNIIEKYGFSSDVLRLMAHRVGGACGQHGQEQVGQYQSQLLDLFSNDPDQKSLFLTTAVQSIYHFWFCSHLWFEAVRYLGIYIQDDEERAEWLQEQEQEAKSIFGHNIDMTEY